MNPLPADVLWPAVALGDALAAVARASGRQHPRRVDPPPAETPEVVARWVEAAADSLGIEAEPVTTRHADVADFLARSAPLLVAAPLDAGTKYLVILRGGRRWVRVLTPELAPAAVSAAAIRAVLCQGAEAAPAAALDRLFAGVEIPPARRAAARAALLTAQVADRVVGGAWLLRGPDRVRWAGPLLALVGGQFAEYAGWLLAWWLLGWMTLSGRTEPGWLLAWGLILLTIIPARLVAMAAAGNLTLRYGTALRRRLLRAALGMSPDAVRSQGVGQLLGRVEEADALDRFALTGGLQLVTAAIGLALSALVLAIGAGGWPAVGVLLVLLAVVLVRGWRVARWRTEWTADRLAVANDLVEQMLGHRTRLAQLPRTRWNDGEDRALCRYHAVSADLDRAATRLEVLIPRVWVVAGLLLLAPGFITATTPVTALAVGVGGVLLARQALQQLTEGLGRLAVAAAAWRYVSPLLRNEQPPELVGRPGWGERTSRLADERPVIEMREVSYHFDRRPGDVVRGTSLTIVAGDRVLLHGSSGAGKSTLAALLAGLRAPTGGLLLLHGLDRPTLGSAAWRRSVVLAPQYHENHVLLGSLAYNLFLGKRWPPTADDLAEADALCRDLGLGELLDRMPGGLFQMVGETGWQLSQGERSRLFLARAILQRADLIVLDESLAALDPVTLERSLRVVCDTAASLVLIHHH